MSASALGHYLNGLKVGSITSWCHAARRTRCSSSESHSPLSRHYIAMSGLAVTWVLFPCLEPSLTRLANTHAPSLYTHTRIHTRCICLCLLHCSRPSPANVHTHATHHPPQHALGFHKTLRLFLESSSIRNLSVEVTQSNTSPTIDHAYASATSLTLTLGPPPSSMPHTTGYAHSSLRYTRMHAHPHSITTAYAHIHTIRRHTFPRSLNTRSLNTQFHAIHGLHSSPAPKRIPLSYHRYPNTHLTRPSASKRTALSSSAASFL